MALNKKMDHTVLDVGKVTVKITELWLCIFLNFRNFLMWNLSNLWSVEVVLEFTLNVKRTGQR